MYEKHNEFCRKKYRYLIVMVVLILTAVLYRVKYSLVRGNCIQRFSRKYTRKIRRQ